MAQNWWFKFDFRVWRTDSDLRRCSMETRGFWLDCLCAMYEADTCELSGNLNEIARLLGCFPDEITRCANELQRTQTADVTISDDHIHLKSRRLERELSVREGNRKRQAKVRENGGGDPERWTAIRAVILTRDNKICAYCGRRATTVDHIFPKSRGGSHDPSNLVACCKKCNERKNNRTPDEAGMSFITSFNAEVLQSHAEVTPKSPYIVKSKSNKKEIIQEREPLSAASPRGTRIADPFNLTPEMREWGKDKRPLVDLVLETEKFVNYWRAKAGRDGVKLDWTATWRNWILNSKDSSQITPRTVGKSTITNDEPLPPCIACGVADCGTVHTPEELYDAIKAAA